MTGSNNNIIIIIASRWLCESHAYITIRRGNEARTYYYYVTSAKGITEIRKTIDVNAFSPSDPDDLRGTISNDVDRRRRRHAPSSSVIIIIIVIDTVTIYNNYMCTAGRWDVLYNNTISIRHVVAQTYAERHIQTYVCIASGANNNRSNCVSFNTM